MRNFLKHVYRLGLKEVKSFLNDKVFFIFVIWSFTLNIIVVSNAGNMDVKNASIAVVNEDNSQYNINIELNATGDLNYDAEELANAVIKKIVVAKQSSGR